MKDTIDYSLYLVTDSTTALLGERDLVHVVEQALLGGVTVVQYRDKTSDTRVLISIAKSLHVICKAHNIPLLINDRVDVALAINCEGVHLGQDDMPVDAARRILGPEKIIGATVSSVKEAHIAVQNGADYLGIGTLYATQTKKNTKDIIGISGVRDILCSLDSAGEAFKKVKTVCIGGMNVSTIPLIKDQLLAPTLSDAVPKAIDGVAVVSAVIGSSDPRASSEKLLSILKPPSLSPSSPSKQTSQLSPDPSSLSCLFAAASQATKRVYENKPLSHNMTNLVVQNFAANVALAMGASPIMANHGSEANSLAALPNSSLVLNMGSITPENLLHYTTATEAYSRATRPIIFDPVGASATSLRKHTVAHLMASTHFILIKGNEREILQIAETVGIPLPCNPTTPQPGVDTGTALLSLSTRATLVSKLASHLQTIILLTGPTDTISDGDRTYRINNGTPYLSRLTGTGCTLGTALSAYLAVYPEDALHAAVAAILHFEIAAEDAARRDDVKGPGSFGVAFLDELARVGEEVAGGRQGWEGRARVEWVEEGAAKYL